MGLQTSSITSGWKFSELRFLDLPDQINPKLDLMAFYSRDYGDVFEFRLDFLDLDPNYPVGMLFAFDHGYQGNENSPEMPPHININDWNQIIVVHPDGKIFSNDYRDPGENERKISIIRDTTLDAVILKVNKSFLQPHSIKSKVSVRSFGNDGAFVDELGPFLLYGKPPDPKYLVLAFWNTFQSETPSQALRAWDGAHTGPNSTRHGLKALIDAVEYTNVPIDLIDINSQQNKSILDYLNVLSRITKMEDSGLLNLNSIDKNILSTYPFKLIAIEETTPITIIYPTTAMRKNFIDADPNEILVLGGDFSGSFWGNYEVAVQMLSYIKDHPWLRVIPSTPRTTQPASLMFPEEEYLVTVAVRINGLPNNRIKQIIHELVAAYHDERDSEKKELFHQYLGQIGHLLAILEWSKNPRAITDCTNDLDWDQLPECLLATSTIAAVVEPDGGYISFAFAINSGEIHQIIGPSYQLMIGLSDPSSWDMSQKIGADSKMIPGAFAAASNKWLKFISLVAAPGTVALHNPQTGDQRSISIVEDGFVFKYEGNESEHFMLPIILDPWIMGIHGWGDQYLTNQENNQLDCILDDQIMISIKSSEHMQIISFKDSYNDVQSPEQPNFAYPEGHYLPFPLALATINLSGKGIIQIKISF